MHLSNDGRWSAPPGGELQRVENDGEVGQPVGFLTEEMVKQVEAQVDLFKRLTTSLLRITDASDWCDLGGKPYLTDSGVMKVRSVARVSFGVPEVEVREGEDGKGKFIRYTCRLIGSWRGETHADIGTSSTRDPFFGMEHGKPVPFDDVDVASVMKKSITNAQHRVLTKLLGLSGMTWERLEAAGIKQAGGGKARFAGKAREDGSGKWSKEKEELQTMLLELNGGNEQAVLELLQKMTAFRGKDGRDVPGKRAVIEMTDKQVAYHLPRVRAEYKKTFPDGHQEAQAVPPGDLLAQVQALVDRVVAAGGEAPGPATLAAMSREDLDQARWDLEQELRVLEARQTAPAKA